MASYALIEHLALLLTRDPPSGTQLLVDAEAYDALCGYLDRHLMQATMLAVPDAPSGTSSSTDLDELVANIVMWEMGVRVPRFDHQEKRLLHDLFDPFETELRKLVGFSFGEAAKVEHAFVTRIELGLNESARLARDFSEQIDRALEDPSNAEKDALDLVEEYRKRSPDGVKELASGMLAAWVAFRTGYDLTATAAEVSDETGLAGETVGAVFGALTTRQSDVVDYYVAEPVNVMRSKPLIRIDERYAMPSPGLFLPALQAHFETALKTSPLWERYQTHRAGYAEARVADLLRRLLPGATVYTDLKYKSDPAKTAPDQLDVLAFIDRRLFWLR